MLVQCTKCEKKYKIDAAKVTEKGVKITCPSCKNVFVVRKKVEEAEEKEIQNPCSICGAEAKYNLGSDHPLCDICKNKELESFARFAAVDDSEPPAIGEREIDIKKDDGTSLGDLSAGDFAPDAYSTSAISGERVDYTPPPMNIADISPVDAAEVEPKKTTPPKPKPTQPVTSAAPKPVAPVQKATAPQPKPVVPMPKAPPPHVDTTPPPQDDFFASDSPPPGQSIAQTGNDDNLYGAAAPVSQQPKPTKSPVIPPPVKPKDLTPPPFNRPEAPTPASLTQAKRKEPTAPPQPAPKPIEPQKTKGTEEQSATAEESSLEKPPVKQSPVPLILTSILLVSILLYILKILKYF